jgi:hypothetical protein
MLPTETAEYVATRRYADRRAIDRALYAHTRRVMDARRGRVADEALARQPLLTVSGTTVFSADTGYECNRCLHLTGAAYVATSETHRIVNRSGDPTRRPAGLCVQCWSELVRDEDDPADLPNVEVRWC